MKKVFALMLALALAMTAVSAFAETLKIGIFEPATGDNGAGGKQEILGIEYAQSLTPSITLGGVDYDIELVYADNGSDSSKAVTAAQTLVDNGVAIVLGSYGSGCSIAGGEVFATAEIPAIGLSCTNPSVTSLCDYYWRICFLDPFQGSVMANFAKDEFSASKAYVLAMLGEDYGQGLANYFVKAFEGLGGEVVKEDFTEGTADFSAFINNAVSAGADVIFAPCATTYASLIIDQAAAQGIAMPVLAGDTWESSVILEAAQGKNVKVYCSTFFDENDETAAEFVNGFKAWMNANSDKLTNNGGNDIVAAVSALGFDGYNTAIAALKAADSAAPAALVDVLPSLVYEGAVTGTISFDDVGDANKDMAYIKFANPETGAFDFVKTQSVAGLE